MKIITIAALTLLLSTPALGQEPPTYEQLQAQLVTLHEENAELKAELGQYAGQVAWLQSQNNWLYRDKEGMAQALEQASRHQRRTTRQLNNARRRYAALRRSQSYLALRVASAATGVPLRDLRRVAWCESQFNPDAVNPDGNATGLMQFQWRTWLAYPMGQAKLSRRNPYASAMQAALIVRQEGWRQWECKP